MLSNIRLLLALPSIAALLLNLSACSDAVDHSQKAHYLTILHTNDNHGRFWSNERGEYGMAARKTLIDSIRSQVKAAGGHVLLLSGGDINTGVFESDTQDAEPDFRGMSLLGYDAMAVGNHEFDNPVMTIRKQETWSNFPFLAANIYDEQDQRLFKPYKVFDLDGLRVAVLGLITHTTADIGNQQHIRGLRFTLPETETAALMPELEAAAPVVIALTHMGHHSSDIGSDITLAAAVDGLDMIIGGHSSEAVCVDEAGKLIRDYRPGQACMPDRVNGTWIAQAEYWGKYVGRADLKIVGDQVELLGYQLIPVNLKSREGEFIGEEILPDEEAVALLQPFQAVGGGAILDVIGTAAGDFLRSDRSRLPNPYPLGAVITQAMLSAVEADIALFNPGGIRDNIYAGDINMRKVLQVQPFNNHVVMDVFTGEQLITYLEAIKLLPRNENKLQFSGLYFDDAGRLKVANTDEPIDPSASYKVLLNNFMAEGGEGFPELINNPQFVDTGLLDYQVLADFIKQNSPLSPEDF